MWKINFNVHVTMLGLKECFTPEFASELPPKEKEASDLTTDEGMNWANTVKKNK
jgi:hypothetical protein